MGQGEIAIDSFTEVDDGNERVGTLVRPGRSVEHIDQLDWLHRETRLLMRLAYRRFDGTFIGFDPAAG
jgi:hypothetical protein